MRGESEGEGEGGWVRVWVIMIKMSSHHPPSPSHPSVAQMSSSAWLDIYISRHWLSFNDFLVWQRSCWIVVPLQACTCPVGLKIYTCKHSVGLGIVFNLYQVNDKTRVEPLGKRRGKGRPKKVNTAYLK